MIVNKRIVPKGTLRALHGAPGAHAAKGAPPRPPQPKPADLVARAERAERTKDYLLSTLSADVRRPLGELVARADELAANPGPGAAADVLHRIRLLAQAVDDILDLANLDDASGPNATGPTDVGALIDETIDAFKGEADAKGVTLSAEIADMPSVVVNAHRLRLVLRALVENSVKFTAAGRIGIAATYFGGRFKLTVEDTGCGIPLREQNRFAQEGLSSGSPAGVLPSGLAVIERLVLSMNGDISLQSTPGIGTVVSLLFQNVESSAHSVTRRLSGMQRINALRIQDQLPWKANFLLVDGSPVHQAALDGLLKRIGFENTSFAANGSEALVRLMTGTVDIVLTDLPLDQMDGRALVGEIRKTAAFSQLPVYAVTADESIKDTFKELGFDGYVLKPITADKLHSILG